MRQLVLHLRTGNAVVTMGLDPAGEGPCGVSPEFVGSRHRQGGGRQGRHAYRREKTGVPYVVCQVLPALRRPIPRSLRALAEPAREYLVVRYRKDTL